MTEQAHSMLVSLVWSGRRFRCKCSAAKTSEAVDATGQEVAVEVLELVFAYIRILSGADGISFDR